jgi:lipopolysaccharide/colanic/teichoic acid biosynthesis glycosyltransferase
MKREARVGLAGKPFTLYRFDTEPRPVDGAGNGSGWCLRFARFLDRYSLSELPQVWNVIKGDMSFVGPQPESPERVRHYSAWHKRRLQIKPGITGLAQVRGLREKDSSDLKTKFDLEYAANYTPLVDLALVLATLNTLISRRGTSGSRQAFPAWVSSERDPV